MLYGTVIAIAIGFPLRTWLLNFIFYNRSWNYTCGFCRSIYYMVALSWKVYMLYKIHIYIYIWRFGIFISGTLMLCSLSDLFQQWNGLKLILSAWLTFGLELKFSLEAVNIHFLSGDERRRFSLEESHTTCLETSHSAGQVRASRDPTTVPT